jgi:predicted DNA-binding transcriptional regulator YafY
MANVATRLISLILLMQSQPQWKAAELSEELNVSERTIHRYMGMLEEMGIPIYSERGPYGGFSLMRGYKLPPLIFTAEEATVLYMGANLVEAVWGEVYRDAVTAVTAKLDNVLPDELRQEVAQVQQGLVVTELAARDYRPWSKTLQVLRESVSAHRGLHLTYRSFSLEETSREVDPYALTFRWGLWYLVGFCRLRGALRTFRVDRIEAVQPLSRRFTVPEGFSARQYVDTSMQFQNRYTIVVHLSADAAPYVRERMGHWMDLEDHEDGSITVCMQVADLEWATGWVLSQGQAAEVLEPPELVERVRREAAAIASRYISV